MMLMRYIFAMPRLKLETVQIRMTTEEKEILKKLSDKMRMSYSAYIRYLLVRESVTI